MTGEGMRAKVPELIASLRSVSNPDPTHVDCSVCDEQKLICDTLDWLIERVGGL